MQKEWLRKSYSFVLLWHFVVAFSSGQVMKYVSTKADRIYTFSTPHGIELPLPVIRLELQTIGSYTPLALLTIRLKLITKKWPVNVVNAKMYYTGTTDSFSTASLFGVLQNKGGQLWVNGEQELQKGTNYFWVAVDLKEDFVLPKMTEIEFISCTTGVQEYEQAWADEFNNNGPPNPTNWHFEKGFVRNNELQWYTENNADCKNGILTIEARQDTVTNPEFNPAIRDWRTRREQAYYTSSSINTSGLQTWQYGRFELRAKIDTNAGCWPAWWSLGVDGRWPHNGEIDIMEFYKGNILANYAVGTERPYVAKWFSTSTPIAAFNKPAWADRFHNWRMDWDSAGISIYLDDSLLNYQPQAVLYNRSGNNNMYPFRQKHYMLLNLAIGGDNGGDPSRTIFPRKYEIDYVRVWQKIKGKYSSQTIHTIGN